MTNSVADVNITLGASDETPPSAPGTLSVTSGDTSATLSWGAAHDDTGVIGYSVYRWTDPPATLPATPLQPVMVHRGARTSWTDTTVTNGTKYYYLVRAEDAVTNVGPRSNTVDATPASSPEHSRFEPPPTSSAWGGVAV